MQRLKNAWRRLSGFGDADDMLSEILSTDILQDLDRFEVAQLKYVIEVCRQSANLAQAGRKLFNRSRLKREKSNDSDRLRKYLQKYELHFDDVR